MRGTALAGVAVLAAAIWACGSALPRHADPVEIVEQVPTPLPVISPQCVDVAASLSALSVAVFGPQCAITGCHGFTDPTQGFDASSPATVLATASNRLATETLESNGMAVSRLVIAPGDHENSYLWDKVTGAPGITGNRMPDAAPEPLSACELSALEEWIDAGAQND